MFGIRFVFNEFLDDNFGLWVLDLDNGFYLIYRQFLKPKVV